MPTFLPFCHEGHIRLRLIQKFVCSYDPILYVSKYAESHPAIVLSYLLPYVSLAFFFRDPFFTGGGGVGFSMTSR